MPIATINPATGETLRTFTPLTADRARSLGSQLRRIGLSPAPPHHVRRARAADAQGRRDPRGREGDVRPAHGHRDGQAAQGRDRGGRQVRAAAAATTPSTPSGSWPTSRSRPTRRRSWVAYQPIGPVLAVMPWNFPFWQVFRFAAPALDGRQRGPAQARVERAPVRAGDRGDLPPRRLPRGRVPDAADRHRPGARVIEDPRVAAVTLTGSDDAGSQVASAAGKVLKKSVLELGGSDPFIVMPSADLEARGARRRSRRGRSTTASRCIAAKRFIVHEAIADEFERAVRRPDGGAQGRRPDGRGHRHRPAGHREPGD